VGERLGRYEVIRTLARGSLTDLLLGRATGEAGFQRHVAIKQLREEHAQDAACLEMFVNEARIAAALHHHNIVQVTDIGDEAGKPYFAMEYVHGIDLRTLLTHLGKKGEQLPLQHVVAIVASAAAALHHAHEQKAPDGSPLGIVHRQVTPANVLVGFDGNVKLVDFGIAKAAIKRIQTGVGVLKGSAPYMAPEQCAGRTVDRRSDIFALGIVLFELATVRRLFKGENEFLTMSAVVNAEVPRPSQYRRDVPPDLEVIMLKALARDPLARYQTAADMANALDKVARSVGVGASTTALANYLKLQFGERKEPWLSEGQPQVDPEPTQIDFDGNATGLAPPPSEALKSNAIPKTLAATKSSPIMRARTVVLNPAGSASMTMPLDKSFSVATTVDDADPEPASSRVSTEVGDADESTEVGDIESLSSQKKTSPEKSLPDKAAKPPAKPFSTVAVKVPTSPAPSTANDKPATNANARTIALVVNAAAPPERASAPVLPAPPVPPQRTTDAGELSVESSKPAVARDAQLTDATAIVEPLAVVVARAQTTAHKASNKKLLYIGGAVATLLVIIVAIVMWPSSNKLDSSAAPVAKAEPPPEPAKAEPPQKSAMEMTARDYAEARADAGAAADESDAALVAEAPADAAAVDETPDAAVVAAADPDPKAESDAEDLAIPVADAPVETPVAAKTAKRTTVKKTPVKRTAPVKKTTTKKTVTKKTKPKWNPDDLFLGE